MKVIFLDIDGPMVTERSSTMWNHRLSCACFDTEAVRTLNAAVELTSAKIVVSSTWRIGRKLNQLNAIFDEFGVPRAIDTTPVLKNASRGAEIQAWLRRKIGVYAIESFAVIDDDSDISPFEDNWINTPFTVGLNNSHLGRLVELLK